MVFHKTIIVVVAVVYFTELPPPLMYVQTSTAGTDGAVRSPPVGCHGDQWGGSERLCVAILSSSAHEPLSEECGKTSMRRGGAGCTSNSRGTA